MNLRIGVLGPLEVTLDGRPLDIAGGRQRAVLTALVLSRPAVLGVDRLAALVVPDAGGPDARNAAQTYVARLRRSLGPAAGCLRTRPPGYVLDVPAGAVDADRFAALVLPRTDEAALDALLRLEAALDLWRGPAFAEFPDLARAEAARLAEQRRDAEETRLDVLADLGRTAEVVAAASALVAADPGRDRAVRALASALAAAGRTADALDAVRAHRAWLRDETGLDPSRALLALQADLLRDPGPAVAPARRGHPLDAAPATAAAREVGARSSRAAPATPFPARREHVIPGVQGAMSEAERVAPPAEAVAPGDEGGVPRAASTVPGAAGGVVLGDERVVPRTERAVGRAMPGRVPELVGRDHDLAEVVALLEPGRVITVIGPGGVGKTSLALACAAAVGHTPGVVGVAAVGVAAVGVAAVGGAAAGSAAVDGVAAAGSAAAGRAAAAAGGVAAGGVAATWWVDLAALGDPAAVAPAIAAAVGLVVEGRLTDSLAAWARGADGLLVVDNCEHLLDAVHEVLAGLSVEDCPGLRVLATSRERIGLPGERGYVLDPLTAPAAVRLFTLRAAAAEPAFPALAGDLADRVGAVCEALDRLPLAIELAAARVGTLTVDDLAKRLDARLVLLDAGPRGRPARHQTLRAVVDWSWRLLGEQERVAFARLHVFAAGIGLDAAEAVIGYGELPAASVAHVVALLAERSLLTRPGSAGVGRYRMLVSLRVYAAELLDEAGDRELRLRHATYFAGVLEEASAGLQGPDEAAWVAVVEGALDDARQAWQWSRVHAPGVAVRLAGAVAYFGFWHLRADLLAWSTLTLRDAGPRNATRPAPERREAVPDKHDTAPDKHDTAPDKHDAAPDKHDAAPDERDTAPDEHDTAPERRDTPDERPAAEDGARLAVMVGAAYAAWLDGDFDTAAHIARQAVDAGHAAAADLLGDIALIQGDVDGAVAQYRRAIAVLPVGGAARAIAMANLALPLAYRQDPAALPIAEAGLVAARATGNPSAVAFALFALAEALGDGDPTAAIAALDEALRLAGVVGGRFVAGVARTAMVALRGRHGPPEPALALFAGAIRHWRTTGGRPMLIIALRNLVVLFARTGRDVAAIELAAALDAPGGVYGAEAERLALALTAVRVRLPAEDAEEAWLRGGTRTADEAAAHALRHLESAP